MEKRRAMRVVRAYELDRAPEELRLRAGRHPRGRRARLPRRTAGRDPYRRARLRPAPPARERAPARDAREPPQGQDRPLPGVRLRPTLRAPPPSDQPPPSVVPAPPLPARSTAREFLGEARVQLLALPGKDGRVDRLRQQRVAEPKAAPLPPRRPSAIVHCLAERVAQVAVRLVHGCAEQRIPDVASCCRGQAQPPASGGRARATRCSNRSRSPAGAPRSRCSPLRGALRRRTGCPRSGRRSRPSTRQATDGRRERRAAPQARRARRARAEHERGAGAPDAVGESAHSLVRCGVVGAVGRERQTPRSSRLCARTRRDRASRYPPNADPRARAARVRKRRARRAAPGSPRTPAAARPATARRPAKASPSDAERRRTAGTAAPCRRDRSNAQRGPRTRLRERVSASSEASRVLPMPASPTTRTVAPLPPASRRRPLELAELAYPSDECLARASLHSGPWRGPPTRGSGLARRARQPKIRRPKAKDKALCPMRSR